MTVDQLAVPKMEPIAVNVDFGKVSIGAETLSVGIRFGRAAMELSQAAKLFCNTRLSVRLSNQTDQRELFDNRVEVVGVGDTKGIGIKPDWINFTLGFKRTADSHDLFQSRLIDLAQCEGRLTVEDAQAIPERAKRGDDDDDDEPDGEFSDTDEGRRQMSLVFEKGLLIDLVDGATGKKVVTPSKAAAFETAGLLTCSDLQRFIDQHPETFLARLTDLVKGCGKVLAQKIFDAYQMAATVSHNAAANAGVTWYCAKCGTSKPVGNRDSECDDCASSAVVAASDSRIDANGDWDTPDEADLSLPIFEGAEWLAVIDLYHDGDGLWHGSAAIVNHVDDQRGDNFPSSVLQPGRDTPQDAAEEARQRLQAECDRVPQTEEYPFDGDVRTCDLMAAIAAASKRTLK